jgi:NCAIR mutase (PurE)-related protein
MLNHDETAKVRFASLAGGLLSTARVVIVIAASTGANPDRVGSTLSRPIFSVPSAVGRFESVSVQAPRTGIASGSVATRSCGARLGHLCSNREYGLR